MIGEDLVYRDGQVLGIPDKRARTDASLKGWKKDLREAKGSVDETKAVLDRVDLIIKSTYKVLLSRGRRGCYVWCADPALRSYLKDRLELVVRQGGGSALGTANPEVELRPSHPFKELPAAELDPFGNALPLVSLKLAAGSFSQSQTFNSEEVIWVEPPDFVRPCEGLFIAQVLGESMNRRIPNGAWCLFRLNPGGTRNGKVVVAQHHSIADEETGGQYTVKVYRSEKVEAEEGGWRHQRITLSPDSDDPAFAPLAFDGEDADVRVIAELLNVLE
jgi:SOS-response transcriptional repressor LexA